jgi:hypothetical protein
MDEGDYQSGHFGVKPYEFDSSLPTGADKSDVAVKHDCRLSLLPYQRGERVDNDLAGEPRQVLETVCYPPASLRCS